MSVSATLYKWASQTAWSLYELALASVRVIYVWGPPGTGKSFLAQSSDPSHEFESFTCNEDLSVQEAMGMFSPSPSGLLWLDGPLTKAARHGKLLIVNEVARSSQALLDFLLGLVDSGESAAFTLPNGETVRPHKNFRVILTANESPEKLDTALQSRLDVVIEVADPHPALIARLNREIPQLGTLIAKSYADRNPINPRHALSYCARIKEGWPKEAAALACFGPARCVDIHAALWS